MGEVGVAVVRHATPAVARELSKLVRHLADSVAIVTVGHLQQMLASDTSTVFVARLDEDVVGTLTLVTYLLPSGKRARIEEVVVLPAARGEGVALALARAAVDHAREAGARTIDFASTQSSETAEAAGFELSESYTYRQHLDLRGR